MMLPVRLHLSKLLGLLACLALTVVSAQDASKSTSKDASKPAATFKPEELEQIVAPIALYPDSLLAQVFMASTYPLEIVEAARWSKEHADLKGEALQKEIQKQSWDDSVKALTNFPDVITMMNEKLDWTQKLGDAFLAQQKDVMDAVQRLRVKAKDAGNLKSSKEQTVKTEPAPAGAATTQTIIIESTDPEVVYVPSYNPTVVYGAWPYPAYPPYYYYPPAYAAGGMFFAFSVGVVVGGGGCCWGGYPNWNTGDVDIDINNDIDIDRGDNVNVGDGDRGDRGDRGNASPKDAKGGDRGGKQSWQHNPEHRKGVEYRDSASQQKFGKGDRQAAQTREQYRGHAEQGREQMAREGMGNQRDLSGNPISSRESAGNRQGSGNLGGQTRDSAGNMSSQNRPGSGNVGGQTRDTRSSSRGSSSSSGAFSGVGSGSSTRASSSRGMSSRSAGGMSRGGGRRR
jgi:uncharacterized protein DUF3300